MYTLDPIVRHARITDQALIHQLTQVRDEYKRDREERKELWEEYAIQDKWNGAGQRVQDWVEVDKLAVLKRMAREGMIDAYNTQYKNMLADDWRNMDYNLDKRGIQDKTNRLRRMVIGMRTEVREFTGYKEWGVSFVNNFPGDGMIGWHCNATAGLRLILCYSETGESDFRYHAEETMEGVAIDPDRKGWTARLVDFGEKGDKMWHAVSCNGSERFSFGFCTTDGNLKSRNDPERTERIVQSVVDMYERWTR